MLFFFLDSRVVVLFEIKYCTWNKNIVLLCQNFSETTNYDIVDSRFLCNFYLEFFLSHVCKKGGKGEGRNYSEIWLLKE